MCSFMYKCMNKNRYVYIQNSLATLTYNPCDISHQLRVPEEKQYRITFAVVPQLYVS